MDCDSKIIASLEAEIMEHEFDIDRLTHENEELRTAIAKVREKVAKAMLWSKELRRIYDDPFAPSVACFEACDAFMETFPEENNLAVRIHVVGSEVSEATDVARVGIRVADGRAGS
jgi:hypothetical protein